ncbi:MAG: manganese catalase family protein [Tyzzerella sp.]|nr:manganese catalase family protein [Tyzzerella sp.]
MWIYEKRLQYPVKITQTNPKLAQVIMSQFGGPDGELAASMRYLSQRYTMPYKEVTGILTDIGTEELAHMEIVSSIIYQLTKDLSIEEIEKYGFDKYYVDHTLGLWPQAAGGTPFTATYFQSKGDPITDLHEDMAAEQKARTTYDNILRLVKDPEIADPIRFLRAREVVHYQRFGESLRIVQDNLDSKNFYAFNPAFDTKSDCGCK